MENLNDIFRTFGPEYLERFGAEMPKEHRKAMDAILKCRTEEAGIALYECEDCGHPHYVYRSSIFLSPKPTFSNPGSPLCAPIAAGSSSSGRSFWPMGR